MPIYRWRPASAARISSFLVAVSLAAACGGGGGGGNTSNSQLRPSIQLSAVSSSVDWGEVTELTWTVSNASSCTANGGWTGDRATSGSEATDPLSNTTLYSLACDGSGGSATAEVLVSVVDVDGTTLPPDPGSSNDDTLEGTDANQNGVRDDVERHIAENYRDSARLRESLKSFAIHYADALAARASASDSLVLAQKFFTESSCAAAISPDSYVTAIRDISNQFLDTLFRLEAFAEFEAQIGGEVFDTDGVATGEAACSFDWTALPN